jgi:hypothetical protein
MQSTATSGLIPNDSQLIKITFKLGFSQAGMNAVPQAIELNTLILQGFFILACRDLATRSLGEVTAGLNYS